MNYTINDFEYSYQSAEAVCDYIVEHIPMYLVIDSYEHSLKYQYVEVNGLMFDKFKVLLDCLPEEDFAELLDKHLNDVIKEEIMEMLENLEDEIYGFDIYYEE